MSAQIEKIVIVGGGTAGWMSAAFLHKVLGGLGKRAVSITLVESDDVGAIGVGEATIPTIRGMLQLLGVPEWRLLADADATFKTGIRFVDWTAVPVEGQSSHYFHPFDAPIVAEGFNAQTHWLAMKDAGYPMPPLHDATSICAALADANRSPKLMASRPYESPVGYAYHFDAVKLGRLLRELAMEAGVERIVDHVEHVRLNEDGDIRALETRDGRTIEGDFFIDCSGFGGLLIEKTLGEKFVDFSDTLLCDRAVTVQVPFGDDAPAPRCFTTATAKSAGWIWDIDLMTRRGTGHVYSSRFQSDDAAERELLDHIGPLPEGVELTPRRIDMRVGRLENMWVRNCLAVGLSAGFIEPLESTGIRFIELALTLFVDHLAEGDAQIPQRAQFNAVMRNTFDHVADFILLHYIFNRRDGLPFWDHYRAKVILRPSLVAQLQLWAYKMPSRTDLSVAVPVFDGINYFAIMAGMNALPPFGGSLSPFIDPKNSAELLDRIAAIRKQAIESSPPHEQILHKIRATAG